MSLQGQYTVLETIIQVPCDFGQNHRFNNTTIGFQDFSFRIGMNRAYPIPNSVYPSHKLPSFLGPWGDPETLSPSDPFAIPP